MGIHKRILTGIVFMGLVACSQPTNDTSSLGNVEEGTSFRSSSGKSGVMFQGFYWDVPSGGNWYNTLKSKAAGLANMMGGYGIDTIWFPPPQKSESGPYSMGYDPYDYYDLGSYNQKSTTETRFGSQAELKSAISTFHSYGISVMADIVLNHRSGGASESNPVKGGTTPTNFSGVASGKAKWNYLSFHPNSTEAFDEGTFGTYPDVSYVGGSAYNDIKAWMIWLKSTANAGFDQWRFDYVKGYHDWVARDMKAATGGVFSIGENWDQNTVTLANWTTAANMSAFDFPLYYTMRDIFNNTSGGGNMALLVDGSKSFAAKKPMAAVTFVGNHDTNEIYSDKMMAYAFILTYQGYPCIWYKDYYDYGFSTFGGQWGNGINQLVWVRGKLAGAAPSIEVLKSNDSNTLIYGSKGKSASSPGYIVIMNDSPSAWTGYSVTTGNTYLMGKTLKAYAWYSSISGQNYQPGSVTCDTSGVTTVWCPPRGYVVYSTEGL